MLCLKRNGREEHLLKAIRPPNSHDPIPEKSYCDHENQYKPYDRKQREAVHTLDWRVKSVSPRKIPNVINLFSLSTGCGIAAELGTYKACSTTTLSMKAVATPRVNASNNVNELSRMKFRGWL